MTDSYFVVAHFHYVVFGTVVFAANAGIAFWFLKICGRMLDERLGKVQFWMTFIGFHGTFLIQHWLGAEGMLRRYVDYLPTDGFTLLNTISTIFSFVLGASIIPFVYNVTYRGSTEGWHSGTTRGAMGTRWSGRPPHPAAAQLHRDPEDPLRAAGLRGALPAPAGTAASGGARRRGPQPVRGQRDRGRDHRSPSGPSGP